MKFRHRVIPAALGGKPSSRFADRPVTGSVEGVSEEAGSSAGTPFTPSLVSGRGSRVRAEGTV